MVDILIIKKKLSFLVKQAKIEYIDMDNTNYTIIISPLNERNNHLYDISNINWLTINLPEIILIIIKDWIVETPNDYYYASIIKGIFWKYGKTLEEQQIKMNTINIQIQKSNEDILSIKPCKPKPRAIVYPNSDKIIFLNHGKTFINQMPIHSFRDIKLVKKTNIVNKAVKISKQRFIPKALINKALIIVI